MMIRPYRCLWVIKSVGMARAADHRQDARVLRRRRKILRL